MAADAPPANEVLTIDFEVFKRRTTIRTTKGPSHFPHARCGLDTFNAKVLRPLYPIKATGV